MRQRNQVYYQRQSETCFELVSSGPCELSGLHTLACSPFFFFSCQTPLIDIRCSPEKWSMHTSASYTCMLHILLWDRAGEGGKVQVHRQVGRHRRLGSLGGNSSQRPVRGSEACRSETPVCNSQTMTMTERGTKQYSCCHQSSVHAVVVDLTLSTRSVHQFG